MCYSRNYNERNERTNQPTNKLARSHDHLAQVTKRHNEVPYNQNLVQVFGHGSAPFRLIPIRLMWTKLLLTDVFNASWRNPNPNPNPSPYPYSTPNPNLNPNPNPNPNPNHNPITLIPTLTLTPIPTLTQTLTPTL